jgi:hypothetical protein
MGYWTIVVQGCGCHHNAQSGDGLEPPHDANLMAAKFVRDLKAVGHEISDATFTHSGRDNLLPPKVDENAA